MLFINFISFNYSYIVIINLIYFIYKDFKVFKYYL